MSTETTYDPGLPWHYGLTHYPRSRRTVAATDLPVSVSFVRDQFIRAVNGDVENQFIESCIRAAVELGEERMQIAAMPQTWQLVLSGFPSSGLIVLPRRPFIDITSLDYYDADNDADTLVVSPAEFSVTVSGSYVDAQVRALDGASFPSAYGRSDAVTITYRVGFTDTDSPELARFNIGVGLMAAELYKQRTLSVHAVHNTPALLSLDYFWPKKLVV
jgi:uncharacterized phiE125 gp8 family phage protein